MTSSIHYTFKDYIKTSRNPSTRMIGHKNCGLIFNFVDGGASQLWIKILLSAYQNALGPVGTDEPLI
uniref:Uncharacterized protein n=1 Tax=Methanosarcina barkeri (strain Fusaro / DSM 804) TaxID=269797 RepID=Q469W5_METBF